ncbi:MAG TPA: hypothetical protein ENN19_05420, partial [Chloroflexi bacterium]|nr:hypothetical protein [Chloroflexota bacterium]
MTSSNELFTQIPLENRRWDVDDLEDLAAQLAERHAGRLATSERFGPDAPHLASLSEHKSILRQVYEQFQEVTEVEGILSSAGEWILDNYHLIQQTIRQT